MAKNWKTVDPISPESLTLFISDWTDRMIKAGYFTEPNDVKAKEIQEKIEGEILSELKEHLKNG